MRAKNSVVNRGISCVNRGISCVNRGVSCFIRCISSCFIRCNPVFQSWSSRRERVNIQKAATIHLLLGPVYVEHHHTEQEHRQDAGHGHFVFHDPG